MSGGRVAVDALHHEELRAEPLRIELEPRAPRARARRCARARGPCTCACSSMSYSGNTGIHVGQSARAAPRSARSPPSTRHLEEHGLARHPVARRRLRSTTSRVGTTCARAHACERGPTSASSRRQGVFSSISRFLFGGHRQIMSRQRERREVVGAHGRVAAAVGEHHRTDRRSRRRATAGTRAAPRSPPDARARRSAPGTRRESRR